MTLLAKVTRRELTATVAARYRRSSKAERQLILDEFVAVTGYHRKHAVRVLNGRASDTQLKGDVRPVIYDEAVRQALVVLWEASDRICGKRLKPVIPLLVDSLERHGHLDLDSEVRAKLFRVSAATIDRLLAPARSTAKTKKQKRNAPAIRASIPVRTFGDWNDPKPGYVEADLVAHCGNSMAGSLVHTLVLTDIATGWTECIPLVARDASLLVAAIQQAVPTLPFRLRGIDTDNGSEFINESLRAYCEAENIEFTRSRPYRKNDQAWVEQKNGSVVRRLVGYGRLEGIVSAEALGRLYSSSRLFVNFFQPSFKLLSKERSGGRVIKRYETPETPCGRLLADESIDESTKYKLRSILLTLDPLRLLEEIRAVQGHVAGLAAGRKTSMLPHRDADLEQFMASLSNLWRQGEVRPTHRRESKRKHDWRTRKDPFEKVWPEVLVWLETEPDSVAKELFVQLQELHPGVFSDGQLRTLQRRVREWRRAAAQRLVFSDDRLSHLR